MSDLKKYEGVIPAFYACYDDAGEVSPERTRALVQYFIDKGVQGLYVNGSSGECIYQSVEDRKLILEEVMAVAKGKLTIIAHVACNNTKDSIELARHAESLGVDAIATIPPIYFRLPEYSVAKYWNDISAAAPNTDYVIYNIPQLAGVALTPSLYTEMLKNPRVIGVKILQCQFKISKLLLVLVVMIISSLMVQTNNSLVAVSWVLKLVSVVLMALCQNSS